MSTYDLTETMRRIREAQKTLESTKVRPGRTPFGVGGVMKPVPEAEDSADAVEPVDGEGVRTILAMVDTVKKRVAAAERTLVDARAEVVRSEERLRGLEERRDRLMHDVEVLRLYHERRAEADGEPG